MNTKSEKPLPFFVRNDSIERLEALKKTQKKSSLGNNVTNDDDIASVTFFLKKNFPHLFSFLHSFFNFSFSNPKKFFDQGINRIIKW